ncbi:MAG: AMP-binding protein [Chloroflexota bacterium]
MNQGTELHTLVDLLQLSRARYGDRVALALRSREGREEWTYNDLAVRAAAVRIGLERLGVGPGDRVAIWSPNEPWWPAAMFGVFQVGAVLVPLDARGTADFARRVVALTECKVVLLGRDQLSQIGEVSAAALPLGSFADCIPDAERAVDPPRPIGARDLAEIVFTSGTTGEPKGVMVTHGNLAANVVSFSPHLPGNPDYRLLSLLPLSHLFEQTVGLCYLLWCGSSVTYVQTLQPASIFEAVNLDRINGILAVPQVLNLFYQAIEREVQRLGKQRAWGIAHAVAARLPFGLRKYLFKNVHAKLGGAFQFFVSGGAHLDPIIAERWERMGIAVIQGYGATECSPAVTATSLARRKLDSIGKPLPCNEVRLAEDGEIVVRGANVSPGYWNNPRATEEVFRDGWYHTGDIGSIDAEGYVYIRGRKKNLIVLGNGMNVYPEDVEAALLQAPGVRDAVVLGLPDGIGDVQVHAVLLLAEGATAAEVTRAANRSLAAHQRIGGSTVWPDPDFPRTPTLKAKRQPIVEHVQAAATRG